MKSPKIPLLIVFITNLVLVLVLPVHIVGIACIINAICVGVLYLYVKEAESAEKPFISKHAVKAIHQIMNEAKNDARFIFEDDDDALNAVEYMLSVVTVDLNRLTKRN